MNRNWKPTLRRTRLSRGGIFCLGLRRRGAAPSARRCRSHQPAAPGRANTARACIFINLNGGASHLDTFDPKDGPWNPPDADIAAVSGRARRSRASSFPKLSTMTERSAGAARRWPVGKPRTSAAQFYMQTAHSLNPALAAETPHIGAVVAYESGAKGLLPPFLSFNQIGLAGRDVPGRSVCPDDAAGHAHRRRDAQPQFFRRREPAAFRRPLPPASGSGSAAARESAQRAGGGLWRLLLAREEHDVQRRRWTPCSSSPSTMRTATAPTASAARCWWRATPSAPSWASPSSTSRRADGTRTSGQFDRGLATEFYNLTNDLDRAVGSLVRGSAGFGRSRLNPDRDDGRIRPHPGPD